jgi:hypothetical protein
MIRRRRPAAAARYKPTSPSVIGRPCVKRAHQARYVLAHNRSMAVTVSGLVDIRGACSLIGDPPLWSRHVVLTLVLQAYSLAALLSQLTCPIPTCAEILPIT